LRFLPLTVLGFIVAPISGALSNRIPIRVLLGVGLATVGVGLLLMHGVSPDSGWTTLLGGFLVAGIGIGITNPGIGQAAIAVVPVEKSGMGSGINTTFRQVGIATGVAGLGPSSSQASTPRSPNCCRAPRAGSRNHRLRRLASCRRGGPGPDQARGRPRFQRRFVGAFNEIILIAAILSFVGAALGFALVRSRTSFNRPDLRHPDEDAATEARRCLAARRGGWHRRGARPEDALATAGGGGSPAVTDPPRLVVHRPMLRELRIENLLLIERAELRLGKG